MWHIHISDFESLLEVLELCLKWTRLLGDPKSTSGLPILLLLAMEAESLSSLKEEVWIEDTHI